MRKTLFTLFVTTTLATITVPAQAATGAIFSCVSKDGNTITVEKSGANYVLSYKKLRLSNAIKDIMPRNNTIVASRSGHILYSLEFEDNQNSYYVQYQESMGDGKPLFAGIFKVPNNAEPKQFAVCNTKKPMTKNFETSLMPQ
ncbi:hypothetical protein C3Z13_00410 [Avibacterium endocarditidis]|uniref:DUF4124 domain-containing protein n=2 Tax=Avibacterium endocarditidis TaxID=380674 RepID=A0ABX4ZUK5_9PAST|nr:hypothetical protein C3Z13_00410 [Avibacterium endocarditidis]